MDRRDRVRMVFREYMTRVARSFRQLQLRPDDLIGSSGMLPAAGVRVFWFLQTYHDRPRLRRTLARVRRLYPESTAMVVSDGDPDPAIEKVCDTYAARFTLDSRLFGVEHGGKPVQRMLEAFLRTNDDLLIKIDPDTHVRRRFTVLPAGSDSSLYGTVQSAGSGSQRLTSIQGGCILIPRQAATLLANSALLTSERLRPPAIEWAVGSMSKARAASGLTSYDWTLGWVCRELGLLSKEHPEVFSRYKPSLIDALTERRVAVSHPRFEIRQLVDPVFYFSGFVTALGDALRNPSSETS